MSEERSRLEVNTNEDAASDEGSLLSANTNEDAEDDIGAHSYRSARTVVGGT